MVDEKRVSYIHGYADGLISGWEKAQEKERQDINELYPKIFQSILAGLRNDSVYTPTGKELKDLYLEYMSKLVDDCISRVARGEFTACDYCESADTCEEKQDTAE